MWTNRVGQTVEYVIFGNRGQPWTNRGICHIWQPWTNRGICIFGNRGQTVEYAIFGNRGQTDVSVYIYTNAHVLSTYLLIIYMCTYLLLFMHSHLVSHCSFRCAIFPYIE